MGTFLPELRPREQGQTSSDSNLAPDIRVAQQWLEAAYEEARYECAQSEDIAQMAKTIDYLMGRQWPKGRSPLKSRPVDNRMWRIFWEQVGLLTDVRPLFEVKALRKDYDDHADIVNKVTRCWWMESDADMELTLMVIYALMGTGYGKLEWNPFQRNREGDFDFLTISPTDCMPLKPTSTDLQSAQLIVHQKPMPLQWFRNKFGKEGWRVQADIRYSKFQTPGEAPTNMTGMMFENLSPQMKRIVGKPGMVRESYYPMALYRAFWAKDYHLNNSNRTIIMGSPGSSWAYEVKPGEMLYPRGRVFEMGGPYLLNDGPSPYLHGKFPFGALRMNMVPWQFGGASEMRPIMPLQDIVNNILAGVIDMVKKAVNPNFIAPKNAFDPAVWNALDWSLPGAKAQYNPGSPHPPQWAPAPQLPAFVLAVLQLAAREMDASSGIAAMAEAVRKNQVPGSDTLESIKQSQQTPIRLKGRNMEVFLRHFGSMTISNVFQFYTAQRRYWMLGPDGLTYEDFDWKPGEMVPAGVRAEDHIRNFQFLIHPGTLLNIAQEKKAQVLMMLRKNRDLDRTTLLEHLDLGVDPDRINKALQQEMAEQADLMSKLQIQTQVRQAMAQMGIQAIPAMAMAAAGGGAPAGGAQ